MKTIILISALLFSFSSSNDVYWRKLTWDDFKMTPPKTQWAAELQTTLEYNPIELNGKYYPTILAIAHPYGSYIRSHDIVILRHEQTHFDLAESYARLIQRQLKKYQGCDDPQEAVLIYDKWVVEWEDMEKSFDKETSHGLNYSAELKWEQTVSDALDSLPVSKSWE